MTPSSTSTVPELIINVLRSTPAGLILLDEERRPLVVSPSVEAMCERSLEEMRSHDFLQVFVNEDHACLADWLETPCLRPHATRLRSGREVDVKHFPIELEGRVLQTMVLIDSVEERKLLRKLSTLSQFTASLTYAGSLGATLNRLCERIVETTEAVACAIVTRENGVFRISGTCGLDTLKKPVVEAAFNSGYPMPPMVALEAGEPMILRNMKERLREFLGADVPQEVQALVQLGAQQAWNTAMFLPIHINGEAVALMNCYYINEALLDNPEVTFLETLAHLAAVALENARLLQQAEEKAALEERQRLARELHDSVAQAIYGIALGLKTAQAHLERDPAKARGPLSYALDLAEGATQEMRAMIFSLRPETLDEEGLVRALERQVEVLRTRYHIEVETAFALEPELDQRGRYALFRVASEALHNIVKHARARTVRLSLCAARRSCSLEIVDDGIGFDPNQNFPGHLGLKAMRERMEALGGELSVTSHSHSGTRVMARLALQA